MALDFGDLVTVEQPPSEEKPAEQQQQIVDSILGDGGGPQQSSAPAPTQPTEPQQPVTEQPLIDPALPPVPVTSPEQPAQQPMQVQAPPPPKQMWDKLPTQEELDKEPIVHLGDAPGVRRDSRLSRLAAKGATMAFKEFNKDGLKVRITGPLSSTRGAAEQASLREQMGQYAAQVGMSNHEYGMALDVTELEPGALDKFDKVMEKYGFARPYADVPGEEHHYAWQPGTPPGSKERVWKDDDPRMQAWATNTGYRGTTDKKEMFRYTAASYGFSPKGQDIVTRLFLQESGGEGKNADGTLKVSYAGAGGVGQMMPETLAPYLRARLPDKTPEERAKIYAEREDLQADIAVEHFSHLVKRYGGNAAKALAAYNGGDGAVKAAEKYGSFKEFSLAAGGDYTHRDSYHSQTLPYVANILEVDETTAMRWIAGDMPTVESENTPFVEMGPAMGAEPYKDQMDAKYNYLEDMWDPRSQGTTSSPMGIPFGETNPITAGWDFMTNDEREGVVAKVKSGEATSAQAVRAKDLWEGTKMMGLGVVGGLAALIDTGAEIGENAIFGGSPPGVEDKFGFGLTDLAIGLFPRDEKWFHDVQATLDQGRGGKDFMGWAKAVGASILGMENSQPLGELMTTDALKSNAGSLGMEIPFIAGSIITQLALGPSGVLSAEARAQSPVREGIANTLAAPGKTAFVKGEGSAILESMSTMDRVGGAAKWANDVVRKVGFKGLDPKAPAVADTLTWQGLGTLFGYGEGVMMARRDGASDYEQVASGLLGAGLGFILGWGLKPVTSPLKSGGKAAGSKVMQVIKDGANFLPVPVQKYVPNSAADFIRGLDEKLGGWLMQRMLRDIPELGIHTRLRMQKELGIKDTIDNQRLIAGQYEEAAAKRRLTVERANQDFQEATTKRQQAEAAFESEFGKEYKTDISQATRTAQLQGQGWPVKATRASRRGGLRIAENLKDATFKAKKAKVDLDNIVVMPQEQQAMQLGRWKQQNAQVLQDMGVDPAALPPAPELRDALEKSLKEYDKNYKKVLEDHGITDLDLEMYKDAKAELATLREAEMKAKANPVLEDAEAYVRTAGLYEQQASVLRQNADRVEQNFSSFMESEESYINPTLPIEVPRQQMLKANESLDAAVLRSQAKDPVDEVAESYAAASIKAWRTYLDDYANGRPHWSTTDDELSYQTARTTKAILAAEQITPAQHGPRYKKYVGQQIDYVEGRMKQVEKDLKDEGLNPAIRTKKEQELSDLQLRRRKLEAEKNNIGDGDIVQGRWQEDSTAEGDVLSNSGAKIMQDIEFDQMGSKLRQVDPTAVGISSVPGLGWMADPRLAVSKTMQSTIENHPLRDSVARWRSLSPSQRTAQFVSDFKDMYSDFLDALTPSRELQREAGLTPDVGAPEKLPAWLTDPDAAAKAFSTDPADAPDSPMNWFPRDLFDAITEQRMQSQLNKKVVGDVTEPIQTGTKLLGNITSALQNYAELAFPANVTSLIRRADRPFRSLVHMNASAREAAGSIRQAIEATVELLPDNMKSGRWGSAKKNLKPEYAEKMAFAIDNFPRDGGKALKQLVQDHPEMRGPIRMYLGAIRAVEQMKVISPNLDANFRRGVFFHMFPDLKQHQMAGKVVKTINNLRTGLASENMRAIPDLAAARELSTNARQRIAVTESGKDFFADAVNGRIPSGHEARKRMFLGMPEEKQAVALGHTVEPGGKLTPEQKADVEKTVLGLLVERVEFNPAKVAAAQIEGMLQANARREVLGDIASLDVIDTFYKGQPVKALMHLPDGNPPRVPSIANDAIEEGGRKVKSMARVSDALDIHSSEVIEYGGKRAPAGEMYMHPDAMDLWNSKYAAAPMSKAGHENEAFVSSVRLMQLFGSPLPHFWNLTVTQSSRFANQALGSIADTIQKVWNKDISAGEGAKGIGKGVMDFFMAVPDTIGSISAGNKMLRGEAGIDPSVVIHDIVSHGGNLRSIHSLLKSSTQDVIEMMKREGLDPGLDPQSALHTFTKVEPEFQNMLVDNLKLAMAPGSDGKQAVAALGNTLLNSEYHMNSWLTFETLRQSYIGAWYHGVSTHFKIHGERLMKAGLSAQEALSVSKQEVAHELNLATGAVNQYNKLKVAGTDVTDVMYKGPMGDKQGAPAKVMNVAFSALTPGWFRAKVEPLISGANGRKLMDPRTWVTEEAGSELARNRTRNFQYRDPQYAAHTRNKYKRWTALALGTAVVAKELGEYLMQRTGEYQAILTGQPNDPGKEMTDDPKFLSEIRTGPNSAISNPALGLFKMIGGASERILDSKGRLDIQPMSLFRYMTVDQMMDPGKKLGGMLFGERRNQWQGGDEISDLSSLRKFGSDMIHHLLKDSVGNPIKEVFGYDNRYGMFASRVPESQHIASMLGLQVRDYNVEDKVARQLNDIVNTQERYHYRDVARVKDNFRKAVRYGTPEEQDQAMGEMMEEFLKRHPLIGRRAKDSRLSTYFIPDENGNPSYMMGGMAIERHIAEALAPAEMTLESMPDNLKATFLQYMKQREELFGGLPDTPEAYLRGAGVTETPESVPLKQDPDKDHPWRRTKDWFSK